MRIAPGEGPLETDPRALVQSADILLKVNSASNVDRRAEIDWINPSTIVVASLMPLRHPREIEALAKTGAGAFSTDAIPRTTRAQGMDTLSSMGSVSGYKGVLLAAAELPRYLPILSSAAGKLQELKWVPQRPVTYPLQNVVNIALLLVAIGIGTWLALNPAAPIAPLLFPAVIVIALLFGILLIVPIGGADMPTVIAILNSYAGLAAVAMGFALENNLLITAGALDGSSGLILSIIMCKAMNRSYLNVLFGAFGSVKQAAPEGAEQGEYKADTPQSAAQILEQANSVVIIPGYGMAVAQAQHRVRELYDHLKRQGITVRFAIHPVAGRMPGHMNVLLAEADVPYTDLVEMEDVNRDMAQCDIALVIGANDVVNPAANTDESSPIYGMPIIEAGKARTIFAIKRSKNPGFAGIDNALYFDDKTWMLFGDAKYVAGELIKELSGKAG